MKSIVIYFSQSGNTHQIAMAIQSGIKKATGQCDITNLKEAKRKDLRRYDLIGLGSPVLRLGTPVNILAFIHDLPSLEGRHVFPFCTHGALPVSFMAGIVPPLMRKGLTVIGWADWYGGCYLPYIPKPYLTDGHPDEIDMREAEEFGREMAERSQRIYAGETGLIPDLPEGDDADSLWRTEVKASEKVSEARRITQQRMKVNLEKCKYPACTLCIDNCPMDAIDFSVSPPKFKSNCMGDWFCEQICPEGAIEIDYSLIVGPHDLRAKTLFVEKLDEAEAAGRFRRLVPLDEVGWDTHPYETPGHPRLVPPD